MTKNTLPRKIIIIGGGFGGIKAALELEKKNLSNTTITLVSNKSHLEYRPALYRLVTGNSPLEVCIPLRDVFKNKNIELITDSVINVDLSQKELRGSSGSLYKFDFLVLAMGSETMYFDIPGLKEHSFGFTSITQALRLKEHLHQQMLACKISDKDKEEDVCRMHVIVVGGGASGTELAAELATYTKKLAQKHEVDPSLITIDLIEAAPRVLPLMPENISVKVSDRLRHLGINIFLNRTVVKEEVESVYLRDMQLKTKTVIWTAGAKPASLFSQISDLELDKKGRVIVDEFLHAKGFSNIFVIGDGAATLYSGMAQTALHDAKFVAQALSNSLKEKSLRPYSPKKPFYAIPVGPGWAVVLMYGISIYGRLGWWLRRLGDFRFFLSILPFSKAILAFQNGKTICESCSVCIPEADK